MCHASAVVYFNVARGSVVVKTLFYKAEGHGIEIRCNELILPGALRPGFTQPLTEMSTRSRNIMFLESKAWPACKADNLTAICEPTAYPMLYS
jgi:hypothetical protein